MAEPGWCHRTMKAAIRSPFDAAPAPGAATEVVDGILWMRLRLPMALDHVNIYAIDGTDGWTLVDTGLGTRRGKAEMQRLLDGPLAGKPVARVVITHHHPDHVGLAGWFQSEIGAELIATRTAWLFARMLRLDDQDRPTPETLAFWRGAGMDPVILAEREASRPFNYADCVAPMPLGFRRMADGQEIRLGARRFTVRLGHGHAPDHATLWSDDGALVIGGDQFLPTISSNIGVYATEPEADPLGDWLDSIDRFGPLAHEDLLVLPGHKRPFTGLPRRLTQLADGHAAALARLRRHIEEPRVACDCFAPIFGREITGSAYGHALVEAVAHLNHLHARGHVRRWRRDDGAWLWQSI
jgi:glyoxylase-like metal-dependent hydrolase (beta-lactamase superfamily II)